MVQRSGQMGVPVITAGDEVIVGFDRARLARVAARYAGGATGERPRLGLLVKDTAEGVVVGGARPDSPAERAGFRPGDVLLSLDGRPIRSVADVEAATRSARPGQVTEAAARREGAVIRARISW